MPRRVESVPGFVLLVSALAMPAYAAPEPPPTAAPGVAPAAGPSEPSAATCFPACREGFFCRGAECVSLCNPPCPEGQACVEGRRCEVPLPGSVAAPVYEPPPPRVRTFDQRSHGLIGFHLGFAGDVERDSAESPLDSTYGVNVRSDIPVARYLLLGPLFQFGAWRPDTTPTPDRNYYVDIDLAVRARLPITTSSSNFQVWGGVPIGVTLHFLGDDAPGVAATGFGWNVGVLFGGAVHFTPRFGLFAELGWLQHKISHGADVGQDLDFRLTQWNLNVGFALKN